MTNLDRQCAKIRKVLIIHPGAVGDVLLARPALSRLRCRYPQHEMMLLAGLAVGSLLRESAEVDRVLPLESTYMTELFGGPSCVCPVFRHLLQSCDLAVGWLWDREEAISNTLRTLGVQRLHVQSPFSAELGTVHQSARYLEVLTNESAGEVTTHPLHLSDSLRECERQLLQTLGWHGLQPLVILHPGSGSIHKCMDSAHVASIVEWLRREGSFPLLLEGPSDGEAVHRVQCALTVPGPVLRDAELSAVAAVLSHADLYLGLDSGITHLSAALCIPTIACFGPTSPTRWAPLGHKVMIATGAPCACSDWNMVERCREKVCLRIDPERIITLCRDLLKNPIAVPTASLPTLSLLSRCDRFLP